MKTDHLVTGILAHVDAGKTTLSESILYISGAVRNQGRVDHGDAFLDTEELEKERGITIFSKQAEFSFNGRNMTLLDTPGHADFSPETERVLQVLDAAVLVISAADGVTGQVRVLWKLLKSYDIPVFIFVNKMDQTGADAAKVMNEIKNDLSVRAVNFYGLDGGAPDSDRFQEDLAVCDDALLEQYLESGRHITDADISVLLKKRALFPVYFGSALKNSGVRELLTGLSAYSPRPEMPDAFGARVFKISHDPSGARLTWLRVTGGTARVKMTVPSADSDTGSDSARHRTDSASDGLLTSSSPSGIKDTVKRDDPKIDQIRIYSGSRFTQVQEACAGMICAVTGLAHTKPGDGLGFEKNRHSQLIQPLFTRKIIFESGQDLSAALKNLRVLEEEEPMLRINFNESTGEISAQIMGEVEIEILESLCQERFGMHIGFGPPEIIYMETIAAPVEGVGHYEPLRHYAEVHLLLEPSGRGSGLSFGSDCSRDVLALNWQRLVMTHLREKKHKGVLTGSEITDMRITLTGGRASEKHTSGGDFRQATYRAVRQGLMSARSILLEPYCDYTAEIPSKNIGRLISDVQRMDGTSSIESDDSSKSVITGVLPAAEISSYASDLREFTHGQGTISFSFRDYEPCRDPETVIMEKAYDPEADPGNSPDSVFCSHGAGVIVPWNYVREYMHTDTGFASADSGYGGYPESSMKTGAANPDYEVSGNSGENTPETFTSGWRKNQKKPSKSWREDQLSRAAGEEELREIFERTFGADTWNTKLRNEQNAPDDSLSGIWSRDGSLEKLAAASGKPENNFSGAAPAGNGQSESAGLSLSRAKKPGKVSDKPEDFLLVDGYNIIFSWDRLRELASANIDSARDSLIDILSNYQGTRDGSLILVFDAYKVHGGKGEVYHYGNIDVVYTREAETADTYIVKTAHSLKNRGRVTVATSDGIVQMIIFGEGAVRMSARELLDDVNSSRLALQKTWHTNRND